MKKLIKNLRAVAPEMLDELVLGNPGTVVLGDEAMATAACGLSLAGVREATEAARRSAPWASAGARSPAIRNRGDRP
jgi:hypothetical protein